MHPLSVVDARMLLAMNAHARHGCKPSIITSFLDPLPKRLHPSWTATSQFTSARAEPEVIASTQSVVIMARRQDHHHCRCSIVVQSLTMYIDLSLRASFSAIHAPKYQPGVWPTDASVGGLCLSLSTCPATWGASWSTFLLRR